MKVRIHFKDSIDDILKREISQLPDAIDTSNISRYKESLLQVMSEKGYLSRGIDSIYVQDSIVHLHLYAGPTFSLGDIIIGDSEKSILQGSGLDYLNLSDKVLTQENFELFRNRILLHLANAGYPFAGVALDSILIEGNTINSTLKIDKNELTLYDTILITGNATVNKKFLHKYLKLNKGFPYNQFDVVSIKSRVADLPFLEFKADPTVSFVNGKAYFNLPLVNRNASSFDFIIGVLPRTENGVRSWTITGDFTGEFINKLGNGERISLRYRRLKPETQELDAEFDYPYLFNLPFGVDGDFELYRSTSDFLDLRAGLGINYNISRRDYLRVGWNFSSSRLIEVDTSAVLSTGKLPQQLDVNVTAGRVSLIVDRLNFRFNPRSGFKFRIQAEAGQKKIIPNLTITSLTGGNNDFSTAYDSLRLTSFQSQLLLDLDYFINIRGWSTLRIANRSAYKYNQDRIYLNEYFRIGGNKLLRGFNEESIFTPFYSVFTAEFRIILDQFSFISLPFIDYGIFRFTENNDERWESALGIGLGLNFATKVGIFNIAFASGSSRGSGFDFGDTKIHFGFVNLF